MSTAARTPLLRVTGIWKHFGPVEALAGADLEVHAHEVVALVGDNAAGKSTLAKIIAGALQPDEGTIELDGRPVTLPNTAAAREHRIATVFQDVTVAPNLDVVGNIFLGRERRGAFGMLDEHEMLDQSRQVVRELGIRVPSLHIPVGRLSKGQQQAVAIARTLLGEPKVIVLDEPAATLSMTQTAELLGHVERLRNLGLGVLLISHNPQDVRAVADRVEVLRHGRNNGSFPGAHVTNEELIAAITGATRYRHH